MLALSSISQAPSPYKSLPLRLRRRSNPAPIRTTCSPAISLSTRFVSTPISPSLSSASSIHRRQVITDYEVESPITPGQRTQAGAVKSPSYPSNFRSLQSGVPPAAPTPPETAELSWTWGRGRRGGEWGASTSASPISAYSYDGYRYRNWDSEYGVEGGYWAAGRSASTYASPWWRPEASEVRTPELEMDNSRALVVARHGYGFGSRKEENYSPRAYKSPSAMVAGAGAGRCWDLVRIPQHAAPAIRESQ